MSETLDTACELPVDRSHDAAGEALQEEIQEIVRTESQLAREAAEAERAETGTPDVEATNVELQPARSQSGQACIPRGESGLFGRGDSYQIGRIDADYVDGSKLRDLPDGEEVEAKGRLGRDPRAREDFEDPDNLHATPHELRVATWNLTYAPDSQGFPLRFKGPSAYPHGLPITERDRAALLRENPEVGERFSRIRAAEYYYNVRTARAQDSPLDWIRYILMLGPKPRDASDSCGPDVIGSPWPGRKAIGSRFEPKTTSNSRSAKAPEPVQEIAPAVLGFRDEVFKSVAEDGDNVPKDTAIALAYMWGYIPSEADKWRVPERCSRHDFDSWLTTILHPVDREIDTLLSAFQVFDKYNTGFVSRFTFDSILSQLGESLSAEDIDEALKRCGGINRERVMYEEFLRSLLEKNRRLPALRYYEDIGIDPSVLPEQGTHEAHF